MVLDTSALDEVVAGRAARMKVPVPDGSAVDLVFHQIRDRGGMTQTLEGEIEGQPQKTVAQFVYHDGIVHGSVARYDVDRHFEYRILQSGFLMVTELDLSSMKSDCGGSPSAVGAELAAAENGAAAEAGGPMGGGTPSPDTAGFTTIDIVVGYDAGARVADGGVSQIEARIISSVDRMNLAFQNSLVTQTEMMLLGVVEDPNYVFPGDVADEMGEELADLNSTTSTNPELNTVSDYANALGADLKAFVVRDVDGSAGIAYKPGTSSITARTYMTSTRITFEHEVGHNIGASHSWGDSSGDTSKTVHSYGWRLAPAGQTRVRTIMAYDWGWGNGTRIPYFANPAVTYQGARTGQVNGYNATGDALSDSRYVSGGLEGTHGAGFDGTNPSLGARNGPYLLSQAPGRAGLRARTAFDVVNPAAGTVWTRGQALDIYWTGGDYDDVVSITLYKGGVLQSTLGSGISGEQRRFTWTIPIGIAVGNDYMIRVTRNGTISDDSGLFTIAAGPTDNSLSSLTITGATLTPAFSSTVTSYQSIVDSAVTSVTLSATANQEGATIQMRVNGGAYASVASGGTSAPLPLNLGSNLIEVLVTPLVGPSATYSVTMARGLIPQTITFNAIPDQLATNALVLAATGGATGNPVTFAVTVGPGVITGGNNLTFSGAGAVSVTASQAGNTFYAAATNVTRTFNVTKTAATVTLTAATLSQTYNGSARIVSATTAPASLPVVVTYDGVGTTPVNAGSYAILASINHPLYQGSATGTLIVAKAVATVTLSSLSQTHNGSARIPSATTNPAGLFVAFTFDGSGTPPVNAGSYAVQGTVVDANYTGSGGGTLVVAKAAQSISFGPIADPVRTATLPLSATGGGSGNPVTFAVSSGPAVISGGNQMTFTGIGPVTVTASQAGGPNHLAAPDVPVTFTVQKAPAVVTLTAATLSQTFTGGPRSVSYTTSPPGLSATLTYNGQANAPVNAGTYTVVATINDPSYQGSMTGSLVVEKAPQALNFAALPDRYVTQTLALSASGGASGQPVVFEVTEGPATLGQGNVLSFSGSGRVTIRATQSGSANFNAATPVSQSFQVTRFPATLTLSQLNQVYTGAPAPVTVTTNPPGLNVGLLYDGTNDVPVEPGSYSIIAFVQEEQYEGDINATLVIAKAPQVINFPAPPSVNALQSVSLSATGGPTGNPVTFEVFNGPGLITGGNQLSFTAAGNVVVRARQAGNARYLDATPVDRTVVVSKAPATLALGNLSHTYDGTAKSPSATTDPPGLAVTYAYNGSTAPAVDAGDYAVLANIDDPRYQGSATANLAIAKAAQSIHFPQPAAPITTDTLILSANGGGSGNPITFAVTGGPGNLQGGNQLVFTGAGAVTVTASQSGNGNYLDAPAVPRTLTVTKAPVTSLRLTRLHQVFDGSPREVVAVTQPPGLDVTITYAGSPAAPTGTGNYSLVAEIDDPIYEGSTTATLLVDDPGRMIAVSGGSLPAVGPIPAVEAATFLLGRYEATWGVWRQVRDWAAGHGYDLAAVGTGCADDHPVRGVSWFDAVKWCNARTEWENALLGRTLAPAYRISGSVYRSGEPANAAEVVCDPGTSGYRLPDHAERLYAARGGSASTGQPYPGGSDPLLLGWHAANAAGAPCDLSGGRGTQPAGFLQANELGFHDLAGNVAEWTGDNPEGIPAQRAHSGGDWDSPASALLLSAQSGSVPTGRSNRIGLRLARSVSAALAAALDGAGLEWDSGGTAPWFAQTGQSHDTLDAAAAGSLTGIEANWIETTANGPANLTFRWKSRLPVGSGALIVLRDGIEQSRIHGSTDWTAASVYLPAGSHVVRWRFERTQPSGPPPAAVTGENGAWLDDAALVPAVLPQVVTDPASGITDNSATGAGQVTDDGGSPVSARGLVLATSSAPVVETGLVFPAAAGGTGAFTSALAGLTPGTTYYLRAYATNEVGTAYGTERRLTTDEFVALVNGTATRNRIIASGDRQVFHFTLSGPREAVFATTGGAALRAELHDGTGRLLASFTGDTDVSLAGALYPGDYSLHVFRGPDADGPQSFNLSVDATVDARSQPDVAAGPGLSSLVRADVVIFSQNASPVAAVTTVANAGRLPDRFRVSGTRGNQFFAVTYQSVGGGIITSTVVAGRHETALLALGDAAELVRIRVVPNRKLLRKTSGGRTVTLRRTHAMSIRATSVFDRVSSDSVSVSVRTR